MSRYFDEIAEYVFNKFFTIADIIADISGNRVQVGGIAGESRDTVSGALHGFSSGARSGDRALILRRRAGAYSLISTTHATDEQPGDRTIWTSDLTFLMRNKAMKITDKTTGDTFTVDATIPTIPNPANPAATTLLPVARHGDGIMIGGMVIPNTIVATTLEVKAK